MILELELHRLSAKTQRVYLHAVQSLANHYQRSPDQLTVEKVRGYVHYLITERKLAWGTCNVAMAGLSFLYKRVLGRTDITLELPPRKQRKKLPEVLSRDELRRLFEATANRKHRALLMTTYAAGLRVSEVVHLRNADIDSQRMMIRVEQGKGNKDRYTILADRLLVALRGYWSIARSPKWLFPGRDQDRPLTAGSALRAFYKARKLAGIARGRGIHSLRHCFGTHLLEAGVDPRTIQVLMGHRSLQTTARYMQISRKQFALAKNALDEFDLPTETASRVE